MTPFDLHEITHALALPASEDVGPSFRTVLVLAVAWTVVSAVALFASW